MSKLITFLHKNLHHARGITPKRVTNGGAHLRGWTAQQRHSGGEPLTTVSDLTGPAIEPTTYRAYSNNHNYSIKIKTLLENNMQRTTILRCKGCYIQ